MREALKKVLCTPMFSLSCLTFPRARFLNFAQQGPFLASRFPLHLQGISWRLRALWGGPSFGLRKTPAIFNPGGGGGGGGEVINSLPSQSSGAGELL